MEGKNKVLVFAVLALLVCGLPASSTVWAQGRGMRPMMRGMAQGNSGAAALTNLQFALQQAGATALTTDQSSQLTALVSSFRSNLPQPGLDTALVNAQSAYDNAILNRDATGAGNAAATIAAESAKFESTELTARAQAEISALGILTSDQVAALQSKLGTNGLIRTVGMLFGGFIMGPRGGRGPMPMIRR